MKGRLPSFLQYNTAKDLVRVGRDHDGGYLVSQSDIDKSDVLVGLGISDDWSFESDFVSMKEVEVFAYDASVSQKIFFKRILVALTRLDKPRRLMHWLKVYFEYRNFFSKEKHHHILKYIGLNSRSLAGVHCTLESVLDELDHEHIFLKIDVEGSEYRFLDTLVAYQNRISGLVLEFHDCDVHMEKIKRFVDDFDLKLVHVHANNHAPLRLDDELPLVLELTFSSNAELKRSATLPHLLDMPNNKNEAEIHLTVGD
jgi:hypothetical protein